jgi:hypothetical protein
MLFPIKISRHSTQSHHHIGHEISQMVLQQRLIPCTLAALASSVVLATSPSLAESPWGFVEVQGQSKEFKGFSTVDPETSTDSFQVLGSVSKKYVIENLQGEKIVSRAKGFTVNSCVLTLSGAEEDSLGIAFQSLFSNNEKMAYAEGPDGKREVCARSTGSNLKVACQTSCESSCQTSIRSYKEGVSKSSGLDLDKGSVDRVLKSCVRDCKSECNKSGRASEFTELVRR